MSFSRLPYELQETILAEQDKSDLTSLCLVSKSFLEIAGPLLYRSLKITFYSKDDEKGFYEEDEEDKEEEVLHKYQEEEEDAATRNGLNSESFEKSFLQKISSQADLLRTFGQRPDWTTYVKEVEAVIADNPDQLVPELFHLVSSFSALQSLKISPGGWTEIVCSKAMDNLIESCSRTLRSICLDQAELKTDELQRVLRNFPLLESLALPEWNASEGPPVTTSYEAITLAHLKEIVILNPNRPFFHSLKIFLPSLVSLSVDFDALESLDPSRLSPIQALTLSGYLDRDETASLSIVPEILRGCTSLRSLKLLDENDQEDSQVSKELPTRRFLHNLSPTLQIISLSMINLDSSYLVDWISSTSPTLKQITLSRLTYSTISTISKGLGRHRLLRKIQCDTVKEKEIEEICRERRIELSWVNSKDEDA